MDVRKRFLDPERLSPGDVLEILPRLHQTKGLDFGHETNNRETAW